MKKQILTLSLAIFILACNNQPSTNTKAEETKPVATESNSDIDKGLALVAKSDCLTCHKIKDVLIGPAYNLVGKKYENTDANISMLADKVIKGGTGIWGQVPMTPHPNISKEDATLMVKYVLSLKDEK